MKRPIVLITIFFLFAIQIVSAQQAADGHYFTSFDGVKIYYEIKGDGYPVLLIHGFSGTSQGWKKGQLYNDLLKAGYKVILIDLRGNGQSDKPHQEEAYARNAESKDIMVLMNSLNIESYNVVGYSRGSIIASVMLVSDRRVNKTVMGGMGDAYTDPEWPRRIHAYKALMGDTTLHDVDDMVKYIHSQHFDVLALALQQKYQPSTSKEQLSVVRKPVLIIRGTEDKGDGSETGLQQIIPGSKLVYVPGNHNTASGTSQFSEAVISFFK